MTTTLALVGAITLFALSLFFAFSRFYKVAHRKPDWKTMEFYASQVALLFSQQEQQFLRSRLHQKSFTRIHRMRMRLAWRYSSRLRTDLMHFANSLAGVEEVRGLVREAQAINLLLLGIQYRAALSFLFPREPLREYRFANRWSDLSRSVEGAAHRSA